MLDNMLLLFFESCKFDRYIRFVVYFFIIILVGEFLILCFKFILIFRIFFIMVKLGFIIIIICLIIYVRLIIYR